MATPVLSLHGGAGAKATNNTICNVLSIEKPYFAIIVGAGLSGAVLAEQLARKGRRILVLDKRDHIGGNVYDEIEPESGLRVAKYGAHIFHTNDEGVWAYVNRFGRWQRWDQRVLTRVGNRFVPVPANINTVNALFGENISTEAGMREWLAGEQIGREEEALNSEQVALARVGPRLYHALFETYTLKQWGVPASALDPLVLQRIPVRENFDDRYFGDKYQALPIEGYTALVTSLLAHPAIEVRTGVDFFAGRDKWEAAAKWVLYTGPVDSFFPHAGLARLEYRSILFEKKIIDCVGYVQPCAQINYADDTTPFTRSVEYKHFLHQKSPTDKTVVISERTTNTGEPYYPMPTQNNKDIFAAYQKLAIEAEARKTLPRVRFIGRLARYKYINMDQAVRAAIDAAAEVERVEVSDVSDAAFIG